MDLRAGVARLLMMPRASATLLGVVTGVALVLLAVGLRLAATSVAPKPAQQERRPERAVAVLVSDVPRTPMCVITQVGAPPVTTASSTMPSELTMKAPTPSRAAAPVAKPRVKRASTPRRGFNDARDIMARAL